MWFTIVCIFAFAVRSIWAQNTLIDWTKTPGGGPSTLRACAQYAYNDAARGGGSVNVFLGCTTNACVCRLDLINKAHDHIQYIVELNCGTDAEPDVQAAIKIYNDYCSANGFPIPGYTYVITQTIEQPTETAPSPEMSVPAVATIIPSNEMVTSTASDGTPVVFTLTPPPNDVITVTAPPTARVTVFISSATYHAQIFPWFSFLRRLTSVPTRLISRLLETIWE